MLQALYTALKEIGVDEELARRAAGAFPDLTEIRRELKFQTWLMAVLIVLTTIAFTMVFFLSTKFPV